MKLRTLTCIAAMAGCHGGAAVARTATNDAGNGAGQPCLQAQFSDSYQRVGDSPFLQLAVYEFDTGGDLGFGGPAADRIELQFLGGAYNTTGSYSLASAPNDNFATCEVCVLVIQDEGGGADPEKFLFQSAGSLTVAASTPPGPSATLQVGFAALQVVEVSIDGDTSVSTPVPGGACYRPNGVLFANGFE
jgi:hypothetical protein